MPLKVALVGCGKIADGHVEEIQKMPARAGVVAVCDRELLMAEQLASRYAIPSHYDSLDEMLRAQRPDVVHITTPPQSHVALARSAIDAGCHVFVEKPLALDYAESKALIEYAAAADRNLTVGYTYLFDPPALEMRRLLAQGTVGDVVHVESWYGYDLSGQFGAEIVADPGHWVHSLPGKLLHNNIDHVLNKVIEFIDDEEPRIDAVAWCGRDADSGNHMHDELRVTIVGKRTSAYASFSANVRPAAHFVRLYGKRTIMHVDYIGRTVTLEPGPTLPSALGRLLPAFGQARQFLRQARRNTVAFARGDFQFFSGLHRLIAKFYDSILEKTPTPIASSDILRTALWTERIFAQTLPVERT
jgi:predicted dehydrogenase